MEYQGGIFLSKKEEMIFRVIEDFRLGKISRKLAALKLGVSEKTIQRKTAAIRKKGIAGVKHGNAGREAHNKVDADLKADIMSIYKSNFLNFNYFHALEMILEEHCLKISYSTFRKWCRDVGLGKVRRRRPAKARVIRERSANEGLMWQLDGSPHRWNGKDKWCLIAAIDDATSDLVGAEFYKTETTWACMNVIRKAIQEKGVPDFILTDEAGWSARSAGKRQQFSQFVRACDEIGIKVIGTPTAESKGRVERQFRTTQDRVVAELEYKKIKTMKDSNRYLKQVYIPEWQKKRTVEACSPSTRYREIPMGMDLQKVFCLKFKRTVNRDQTVHFESETYKVNPERLGRMWKKEVTVNKYEDETIEIYYGDIKLDIDKVKKPTRRWKKGA